MFREGLTRRVYIIVLISAVLWNTAVLSAPLLANAGGIFSKISAYLYIFFSSSCHQIDERSFHILGYKFAVCSRCFSIYIAFLAGTIAYPLYYKYKGLKMPPLWLLLIPAILLFLDAALDILKFFENTVITRSVTGFITGFVLPFYIIPGFVNFFNEIVMLVKRKIKI